MRYQSQNKGQMQTQQPQGPQDAQMGQQPLQGPNQQMMGQQAAVQVLSNGQPVVSHRLNELLELVKQEFVNVSNEASTYLMHKDEFDQKMYAQHMSALQHMRQTIFDLEQAHKKVKEQYEEEIARLKQKLEAAGSGQAASANAPQPPQLEHTSNLFNNGLQGRGQENNGSSQPGAAGHPGANSAEQRGFTGQNAPQLPLPQVSQQQAAQGQPQPGQAQMGYAAAAPAPQAMQPQPAAVPIQPVPQQIQPDQKPPVDAPQVKAAAAVPEAPAAAPAPAAAAPASQPGSGPTPQEVAAQLGNNLTSLDIDTLPASQVKRGDGYVVVYNEKAGNHLDVDLVHSLEHDSVVCCVRFSQDGKFLATGCNRVAHIYDVQTGKLSCRLEDETASRENDLYIRAVCFSPDGKYLATGAEDKQIRVWDIANNKIRYLFTGHEQDIYSLDFSQNGRHIASGSGDRTVRIWDMETGQCIQTLSIEDGVTAVSISPNGKYVAAGSLDHIVRVWDAQTGTLVERLEGPDGHKDSVYSVAFTPNGLDLISGSLDKTIKLWELQAPRGNKIVSGGVCARTIIGHRDFVLSVSTTPDARWLLSGSKDRSVQFWDPTNGQALLMLQAHKNSVISVEPSPVGSLFATGSGDCWAKLWRYFPRSESTSS